MKTLDELRAIFHYDPETGQIFQNGRVAGYIMRSGYRLLSVNKKRIYAHRLIWLLTTGEWPNQEIDHINGNKADNRWGNLREATRQDNARNQTVTTNNSSGFKGVSFHTKVGKWRAVIQGEDHHQCHLGYFNSKEEAASAYQAAAIQRFGQFAKL